MRLEALAVGDLSSEVQVKSEQDVLGVSLRRMHQTLRALIGECERLVGAAVEGKLDVRGNAEKFQGGSARSSAE